MNQDEVLQAIRDMSKDVTIESNTEKPEIFTSYKCIGVFNSNSGIAYNGGVLFSFPQPHPNIIGFKLTGITIFNNNTPNNNSHCYITSDLVMGSYPSYINNTSSPVLACIPLTLPGPTHFYSHTYPLMKCGLNNTGRISFQLRDQNMILWKQIPFIITLTLLISK